MCTLVFDPNFSAGEDGRRLLSSLESSRSAAQFEVYQRDSFGSRFDQLDHKLPDGNAVFMPCKTLERIKGGDHVY